MPETYHHHEPAGTCSICDDHIKALTEHIDGQYMRLTTDERMAIWQHAQTCPILAAQIAAAHAQLEAKQESGEFTGPAQSWQAMPEQIPVEIPVSEEAID